MTKDHNAKPGKPHKAKDKKVTGRPAVNIPSEQDRPWVSEEQMPQQQFDKEEYEEKQGKKK